MLSEQAIKEFQNIYFREYGEAITPERAALLGQNLILLYKAFLKPIPQPKKESRP